MLGLFRRPPRVTPSSDIRIALYPRPAAASARKSEGAGSVLLSLINLPRDYVEAFTSDPPSWWCSAYFADAGNAGNLSMSRASC
jgi:hypothetical protein